jgi:hypothetical protein
MSKVLQCNKSILSLSKLKEEKTANSQNLNVHIHNTNKLKPERTEHYEGDPDITVIYPEEEKENVYAELEKAAVRDVAAATERVKELEYIVKEKDNVCQALSLIIDLLQNNPGKINTIVIPSEETLIELIKLLCDCEIVELKKSLPDVECCGTVGNFILVDSIFVTKNDDTFNLKYNCPAVIKILEDHHISYKYIKTE